MKKFTSYAITALLAGFGLSANAQTYLADATSKPADGSTVGYLSNLILEWEEDVELVDEDAKINVTLAGNEFEIGGFSHPMDWDWSSGSGEQIIHNNQYQVNLYTCTNDPTTFLPLYGEMVITIPENLVKSTTSEAINKGQTITLNLVKETYNYNSSPNQYGKYNKETLSDVTIQFPDATEITLTEPQKEISYSINGDVNTLDNENIDIVDNKILLDLSGMPEGEFYVKIPSNYISYTDSQGITVINGDISLTYTMFNGMELATRLSPEYYNVGSLETPIKLTWDYQTVTAVDEFNFYAKIECYQAGIYSEELPEGALKLVTVNESGEVENTEAQADLPSGNLLIIDLSSYVGKIPSGANFSVIVPQGIVTGEKGINQAQTISLVYYEPYAEEAVISIDENKIMTINWPETSSIRGADGPSLLLVDSNDNIEVLPWKNYANLNGIVQIPTQSETEGVANNQLEVNLSELDLDETAEYTLIVPACTVLIFANNLAYSNAEVEYPFILNPEEIEDDTTGVNNIIDNETGVFNVYNLQGVKILSTGNSVDLNNLPTGIYIINGKKVLLNK